MKSVQHLGCSALEGVSSGQIYISRSWGPEHVSGAENGAERPENRVERSGAVSERTWEKNGGAERSAEREVAERERSVERAMNWPLTARSNVIFH